MENIKIGFIGCGTMGSAIATRVAMNQRYSVYVSDYSSEIAESLATTVEEKANTCLELSSAYWAKYSYANNPQKIHIRQALDYAKKAYSLDQTVDAKQQINDLQKLL